MKLHIVNESIQNNIDNSNYQNDLIKNNERNDNLNEVNCQVNSELQGQTKSPSTNKET